MKTLKQKERADDRTEFENDNSQNNEQNAVAKFILTTWNSALLPFWPWKCWCEYWHMWTTINPLWMQRWTAEHRAQPFRLPFACFWQLANFNPFTRNYRICAMSGLWFLDRSNEFHFSSIFIHTRDEMRVCGILHHVCDLSQAQQIFVFVVIVKYNALRMKNGWNRYACIHFYLISATISCSIHVCFFPDSTHLLAHRSVWMWSSPFI